MAIDSQSKRNAAFLDPWAVLIPDANISPADRQTLVGQYPLEVAADDTPGPAFQSLGDVVRRGYKAFWRGRVR